MKALTSLLQALFLDETIRVEDAPGCRGRKVFPLPFAAGSAAAGASASEVSSSSAAEAAASAEAAWT